eukprot:TRINITY_DN8990_c0_g1_i3.p1 TRINITY_DN8990_c0_g1~~TRINITY_DN8990_c0_g1_i3.p1  ORF type:complete len:866 (+),score=176.29 TRINITY_DN8990_c0_g1_i3:123-2720(+)
MDVRPLSPRRGLEDDDFEEYAQFKFDDMEINEILDSAAPSRPYDEKRTSGPRRFTLTNPSATVLEDIYGVSPISPRPLPSTFQMALQASAITVDQEGQMMSPRRNGASLFAGSYPRNDKRFSAMFSQNEFDFLVQNTRPNERKDSKIITISGITQDTNIGEEANAEMLHTHFGFANDVTPQWALGLWLAQNSEASPEVPFHEVLLAPDLILATALCRIIPVTEAEEVAKSLVRVFQRYDDSVRLIKVAIKREVAITESANTLFRSNSMSCKLLSHFSRMIGSKYLEAVLKSHIQAICSRNINLEVDPFKLKDKGQIDVNMRELNMWAQAILDSIVCSISECPSPFRVICQHLKAEVNKRFPEKKYIAIGSFIFLRFFCPAIVAPHAFGVMKKPPGEESQRSLVLVSKVLQNLANGTEFGSKEPWMAHMNTFLMQNEEKMRDFCSQLGAPSADTTAQNEVQFTIPKPLFDQCMDHLAQSVDKHLTQIAGRIGKKKIMASVSYRTLDRLLASIPPSKRPTTVRLKGQSMDIVSSANVEPLANIVDMLFCPTKKLLRVLLDQVLASKGSSRYDSLVKGMFKLFHANGRSLFLLDAVVRFETEKYGNAQAFLGGSITQSLLGLFFTTEGQSYLQRCISPIIQLVNLYPQPFIIDPNPTSASARQAAEIIEIIKEALGRFFTSEDICPGIIRHVLRILFNNLSKTFDAHDCYMVLSSFFVIDFLCPGLSSPEVYGIVADKEALPKNAKRGMAILSKIFMNISTKKHYKEVHMAEFNNVIDANISKLHDFLTVIAYPAKAVPSMCCAEYTLAEVMGYAHTLYDFVCDNASEICKAVEDHEAELVVSYEFMDVVSSSVQVYKAKGADKPKRW